jgi:hypothetical protein
MRSGAEASRATIGIDDKGMSELICRHIPYSAGHAYQIEIKGTGSPSCFTWPMLKTAGATIQVRSKLPWVISDMQQASGVTADM